MSKDNGVSKAALSVARICDRLAPGEYSLKLIKPGYGKQHYWTVEINSLHQIDRITLGVTEIANIEKEG